MPDIITIFKKLKPYLRNKYIMSLLVFTVWVALFDENDLLERVQLKKELNQLQKDKSYYQERIETDSKRLHELNTNKKNLEKFAREQFLMRKENEDVFIIVRD